MVRRIARYVLTGPQRADDPSPLLQRVRWRFVLLNLIGVVLAPINLVNLASEPDAHPIVYGLAVAAFAGWVVALYATGGRRRWLDPFGPLLVGITGVSAGHYAWVFGALYIALFLHSLYGERNRTLVNAVSYLFAYQVVVWLTVGRAEVFSEQLVSHVIAVLIMSWVLSEMAQSLRRSDDARWRGDALAVAGRRLLRATDPGEVVEIALDGVVALATEDGVPPRRVTIWREAHDHLRLVANFGPPPTSTQVDLSLMPASPVSEYRTAEPVRLGPELMREAQRAAGEPVSACHGLAIPLTNGDAPVGLIFVETEQALDGAAAATLQRFGDETSLAERSARRSQLFAGVLNNSADGIVLVDDRCEVIFASPAVAELAGRQLGAGEHLGALLVVGDDAAPVSDLVDVTTRHSELAVRHPDGHLVEVEVSVRAIAGEGTVLNLRDVSEQRRLQEEISFRAHHDHVTGLPNRVLFLDRLEHTLHAAADRGRRIGVALLDLDDFKAINDRFGHLAGDRVLGHVAEQVLSAVRSTDTFARLGGDEFALLLEDVASDADPQCILADVLAALRRPISVDGHLVTVTASCGLVTSSGERSAEEVLGDADLAMYAAKSEGKDAAILFGPGLREAADERRLLLAELQSGLDAGELRVYYQPVMSLAGGHPVGVEALVRWQHPTRGLLTPDRFVPLAEESGLISALGQRVLETACADLASWVASGSVDTTFQLHVNLSAHQLVETDLADRVEATVAAAGIRPDQLILEVTETALAANPELAEQTLQRIHDLHVGIAIDDFGTGYASFTYLQRFPVDIVKIDRSFVRDVADGPEEAALARAIVRLAKTLHMITVAEGVEDEASRRLLAGWGCDHAQGWLWAPALPAEELRGWLADRLRRASA